MRSKIIPVIKNLYEGSSSRSCKFRYGLLFMDIFTLQFLITSSFFYKHPYIEGLDIFFGIYIIADFLARFAITSEKIKFFKTPLNLVDCVVIFSLLAPVAGENLAFLRVFRVYRTLHSPLLRKTLRRDFLTYRLYEDVFMSATNLMLFIFAMTELVFVTQHGINADIRNFLDALYFTVSTLTTTGFGDITLQNAIGKFLSVIIMIFGVSLFLRLIQTLLRPSKVRYSCVQCGLFLHERDSVHCKHCGHVLNIANDGHV